MGVNDDLLLDFTTNLRHHALGHLDLAERCANELPVQRKRRSSLDSRAPLGLSIRKSST
jgi:hypothetical protein